MKSTPALLQLATPLPLRRHARQLVPVEIQDLQRPESPQLRRHARQLVIGEIQPRQRPEFPQLRRHARQLVAAEIQRLQRPEFPQLCTAASIPPSPALGHHPAMLLPKVHVVVVDCTQTLIILVRTRVLMKGG